MTELRNIHSSFDDYAQMANLYHEHKDKVLQHIPVNLYQWFNANMSAPLGAILDLLSENTNWVIFKHVESSIKNILQKNGFLSHFGHTHQVDIHNTTIQYQKMKPEDGRYFREYVSIQFLNRSELPNMSFGLHKKMMEVLIELFVNAQTHSKTKHIYTCGQFFPKRHTIEFCIVDTGIGFKQNFMERFNKKISSVEVIRWAIKNPFPGTMVNVLFRTDDTNNYSLANEKNVTSLF